ncbi:MAG: hypothetical protein FJZ01_18755 [Candidatus Sericytochromatia bacterium]|nr:hypothetical protein [Candidatus Tanganyikabacteria bacterium]
MDFRWVLCAALVAAQVTGCGGWWKAPPPAGSSSPAVVSAPSSIARGVTLLVTARIRSGRLYGTQALEPFTAESIRLLVLEVSHDMGTTYASLSRGDLGTAIRLDGLQAGATYRLQFKAYRSDWANPSEQISDDTASAAEITLHADQPLVATALTVKLRDQLVDARAS